MTKLDEENANCLPTVQIKRANSHEERGQGDPWVFTEQVSKVDEGFGDVKIKKPKTRSLG